MINGENSNSFKKILDFHESTLGESDSEKKVKAKELGIDFDEYKRRIIGKEKEMEFLIFMKSMASIRDIESIDEELSQRSKEYTSDFKVVFTDNYKIMLEVKYTHKDKYKISGGNLQKRIDYAAAQGMHLRFAISIKGFWGLFTSDFIKSNKGKITISDYNDKARNSWLDRELETCSYWFLQPLKIVSTYSKNTTEGLGVFFEPYGELVSYELYCSNNLILRVDHSDCSKEPHMFVLETVQDRLSNIHQEKVCINKETTKIVEYNDDTSYQMFAEYQFIMAIIRHTRYKSENSGSNIFLNSRDNIFLAAKKIDKKPFLVEYIRLVMSDLADLGVQIICSKDGVGYDFNDYRKKFWVKKR